MGMQGIDEKCSLKNCRIAGMRQIQKRNDAEKAEFDSAVAQGAFARNYAFAYTA